MKAILLILVTFSLNFGFSQSQEDFLNKAFLVDKTLRINELLGLEPAQQNYSISYVVDSPRYAYGNRLSFNDSLFYTFYTAPCGNDYFTQVYGPYRIISGNILEINIREIQYHGEWSPPKPKEYPEENWQRFQVIKSDDGFLLKRI
jgi:hypothetical protein